MQAADVLSMPQPVLGKNLACSTKDVDKPGLRQQNLDRICFSCTRSSSETSFAPLAPDQSVGKPGQVR